MPVPSKRPLNPLGIALTRLLEERRMTDADFARRSGLSKAMVSLIKHRLPTKLPGKINVEEWSKLLQLTEEEYASLLEAAELAWSPANIQKLIQRMKLEVPDKPRSVSKTAPKRR